MKKSEQSLKDEARIRKMNIDIMKRKSLPDIDFQKIHEILKQKEIESNLKLDEFQKTARINFEKKRKEEDDEILKGSIILGEKRKKEEDEFINMMKNRTK